MRITNAMTINSFLRNLYNNNSLNNKYGSQLSSNKRIVRISDDPIGVINAIQARKDISSKEQYKKNVSDAKAGLAQAENSLSEMNQIYQRITELAGSVSTEIYGESERAAVAKEVRQIQDALVSLGNTSLAGKYIFGGYNTTKPPFEKNDSGKLLYNGIDIIAVNPSDIAADPVAYKYITDEQEQVVKYEIDQGIEFEVFINGIDLMGLGDDNLYKVIDDFANKLEDPTTNIDDIASYTAKFKKSQNSVLDLITEIGGRQSRLELVENRFENDLINLEDIRTKIEDIDQAEVITKMKVAESIYQATLMVGARIIQPSLLDFLR